MKMINPFPWTKTFIPGCYSRGIAVDGLGNTSDSFSAGPTPIQLGTTNSGNKAFVAKVADAGSAVQYLTFFGGSDSQIGTAVAVDGENKPWAA